MASVQRTPPKTTRSPKKNSSLTQSEPNINLAIEDSDFVNTNRSKRPRQENTPQKSTATHSKDIQSTLTQMQEEQVEQTAILSKLVSEMSDIKKQNNQIQMSNEEIRKTNEEIVKSMCFINNQFEELKLEVEELRREKQEQKLYIENLERKIRDLNHKSRSSAVEIRNIPQDTTESSCTLSKTICNIGETVGLNVLDTDLRDVYRMPGKPGISSTPRPIIAEFSTVQKKQMLISAVRSYNKDKGKYDKINTSAIGMTGARHPIYIAEQLPSQTKSLFYQAREFAKENGYTYCWISNGNIFLRKQEGDKQILVTSEKSLRDLKSSNK